MPLGRGVRAAMFLRSFAIQGSWNYRTLVGAGLAFALLPALRAVYGRSGPRLDEAVRRHAGIFNSHPYLSPMALGAIATLEAEGVEPALVERFKSAIRGSLGSLGDRLVWAGWRPVCLLFALALLLVGVPWWVGVPAFLLVYNAGHLALRVWSYRLGLQWGRGVGEQLRNSMVPRLQRLLNIAGALLAGIVLPLVATGHIADERMALPWVVAAALAAFLGARYGALVRRPITLALVGFALVGLVLQILR